MFGANVSVVRMQRAVGVRTLDNQVPDVGWVNPTTQIMASARRREKRSWGMGKEAPQTETALTGRERSKLPRGVFGSEASKRLEAFTNSDIELAKGALVGVVWDYPRREHKFAKRRAIPKQQQSNLRVVKLSEGGEDSGSFTNALTGVIVAVVANGTAQEFEVAITNPLYVWQKN